ncbi:hypothetical protein J6590_039301 [Homalodisca vitripennis]|nr:hypothetical protein J6590_039301 [Homalodisca vitripennis]
METNECSKCILNSETYGLIERGFTSYFMDCGSSRRLCGVFHVSQRLSITSVTPYHFHVPRISAAACATADSPNCGEI